jgi:heme-degrading monooxygenase HmoA
MFARVTLFELDTLRLPLNEALTRFEAQVLPALRARPGYQGVYALTTPDGKGLLLSLWQTEQDAEAGVESGYYDEQLAKFLMVMRTPPGRDHYEVIYSDVVAPVPG